jgi:hypothetical protein
LIGVGIKMGYRCFEGHYGSHFEQLLLNGVPNIPIRKPREGGCSVSEWLSLDRILRNSLGQVARTEEVHLGIKHGSCEI